MAFVRFLVHFFGCDYGAAYGQFIPYDFWSGVSGSFLVGVVVFGGTWYFHHTCHGSPWCMRWGKYEAAGGTFRLCRHHHPDLRGRKPHHGDLIERLHREYMRGHGGS